MTGPNKTTHHTLEESINDEQHRAFLEKAQEVAHIGSWVAETDGSDRLSWSAETYRIFGVAVGDFLATSEAFFTLVHPDDVEMVRAASAAAIEGRQPYDVEHRIISAAGGIRWVHERADVIRDVHNRAIRMIGTAQDITERRQLELELRHAQKMEAIGRLAGGVAHDLNNALTTIAGYTELALSELPEEHPARKDVEEIRRAAARAESVTRQLLVFSRRQVYESQAFDINEIVEGVARLLERTLGDNVLLRTLLTPSLPLVMGDRGQVEQALVNLAVNARDAMPQGGDLVIRTVVEDVSEAFARTRAPMPPGRFVVLSVTDTGHGLDRDTQARIFEPFFTTKAVGKGTGLGLAMVYGTVKQAGGFIFVESEIGRGAAFKIYFPALSAREAGSLTARSAGSGPAPMPRVSAVPAPSAIHTVLIAEDDPAILNLVGASLRVEGYHLLQAISGHDALLQAAGHAGPISLLLTDAQMPGMSGLDLARTLLADHPDLPVIIMSGNTPDDLGLDTSRHNIFLLPKPFTPVALRSKIRGLLGGAPPKTDR